LFVERIFMRAHAGRGGVGEFGKGESAAAWNEGLIGHDGLAAGAAQPHGPPVVVDGDVGGAQQKEAR
jgi:hypothetical protein